MDKISKAKKRISVTELLGLDPNNPDDQNYLAFKDFMVGLTRAMIERNISKNELARRLKVSRQAVYDKFTGRNLTMKWIQRACDAIGVELRVAFVDKKKAA